MRSKICYGPVRWNVRACRSSMASLTGKHMQRCRWLSGGRASSSGLTAISAPAITIRRSEEHTSELQSLMRISYAVFCLKQKQKNNKTYTNKIKKSLYRTIPDIDT